MQKIVPHLWFDTQAKAAAEFYTTVFPNSKILHSSVLHNTPSGDCDVLSFKVADQEFMAISAGPAFKINPSISFFVNFDPSRDAQAKEHLDELWAKLSEGGFVMMPLQEYPFSKHYGWVQDKYGLSWQLILTDPNGEERPMIVPSLLFVGDVVGKAEEAIKFYVSAFKDSKVGAISPYPEDQGSAKKGQLAYGDFMLENQWFAAMDSGYEHEFSFNEAVSLLVRCDSQAEIDELWEKLSAVPEAEQCGWLKDKFGVSWQISSNSMEKMMSEGTPEQVERVTQAFLKMKKFDLATLDQAYKGA